MNEETRVTVAEERAEKAKRIAADLDERTAALEAVLPSVISVERYKRVVVLALTKNPDLLECTRESILRAVMEAAENGIEPTGPYGGGHLVPFRDRDSGNMEAVLVYDYRGLVKMALRGEVADVEARIVYEGDSFQLELGSEPFVRHIPAFADRGSYLGVYSIIRFRDAAVPPHIDYMTMAEVDKVRDSTRSKGRKGPWADWYDEQVKKTMLRRALKVRATTPAMAEALDREDTIEGAPPIEVHPVSPRRRSLVERIVPESITEGREPVEPPENVPPAEAVAEERDPAFCGDPSPFDPESGCTLPPDHPGIHRIGEDQSWPRK